MQKSPYFNQSPQVNMPTNSQEETVSAKIEFQQYPEEGHAHETIKGLTSIIIPAYFNSYLVFHYTGNCIGSILEHTDPNKTPYEIILIQNGDTGIGFTEKNARDSYADKIIFNKENLGYAKAVNQGIRIANGEFITIVNNDTMVFNHWLSDMQQALEYVDLIQAYPMYGMPYARATIAQKLRDEEILKGDPQNSLDDFRDFSCVLTTKELFNKVGLFNEEFFAYGEDLDLVRRIEKEGGIVKSTKRVRIHHIIGATSSNMPEISEIMNSGKKKLEEIWEK
ncbi:MAG: glycosyltransferase [Rhabdochlamydiaceae bacterium]